MHIFDIYFLLSLTFVWSYMLLNLATITKGETVEINCLWRLHKLSWASNLFILTNIIRSFQAFNLMDLSWRVVDSRRTINKIFKLMTSSGDTKYLLRLLLNHLTYAFCFVHPPFLFTPFRLIPPYPFQAYSLLTPFMLAPLSLLRLLGNSFPHPFSFTPFIPYRRKIQPKYNTFLLSLPYWSMFKKDSFSHL